MKKVQIQEDPKDTKIDWDKCQWVQSTGRPERLVLTHGKHEGDSFTGTALPNDGDPEGKYHTNWGKDGFQRLTTEIPFIISNAD